MSVIYWKIYKKKTTNKK